MHSDEHNAPMAVSVLIRSLPERKHLLKRAIESVLNQSFQDFEILVSIQGNDIPDLGHHFLKNPKLNFVVLENSRGRSQAGNALLSLAKGAFLVFLDDDDEFLKDHLEVLVETLKTHPEAAAAHTLAQEVPTHLVSLEPLMMKEAPAKVHFHPENRKEKSLLVESYLPTQSVLFRRRPIDQGLRFDEELETLEDWVFWASLELTGAFVFVPKITSWYRVPASPWRQRKQFLSWIHCLPLAREKILKQLEVSAKASLTKGQLLEKWAEIDRKRKSPNRMTSQFKVAVKELLWRLS